MNKIIIFLLFLVLALPAFAQEATQGPPLPPKPTSYSIPPHEVWKWRALGAEAQAMGLQAEVAVKKKLDERRTLEEEWRARFNLDGLDGWLVDSEKGELRREK